MTTSGNQPVRMERDMSPRTRVDSREASGSSRVGFGTGPGGPCNSGPAPPPCPGPGGVLGRAARASNWFSGYDIMTKEATETCGWGHVFGVSMGLKKPEARASDF